MVSPPLGVKRGTHLPNLWMSEAFGESRTGREQICLVCSAASEAFGAVRTLSAPTEHVKSEEEGRRTSEPLGSLIGSVLVNQNTVCTLIFCALRSVIPRFHVLQSWHETSCYVRSGRINLCSFGNASLHV